MRIECDECQKEIKVPRSFYGKRIKCPGCACKISIPLPDEGEEPDSEVTAEPVQDSPKRTKRSGTNTGRRRQGGGTRPQSQKARTAKKSVGDQGKPTWIESIKTGALGCGALILVFICVGYYFYAEDNALRHFGYEQIHMLDEGQGQKQLMIAIADHFHNTANGRARPKSASKKSLNMSSEADYWRELKAIIDSKIAGISDKEPSRDILAGHHYEWRIGGTKNFIELKENGSYEQRIMWDSQTESDDPHTVFTGRWSVTNKGFKWEYADGEVEYNEIVCMGRDGFALKEKDNSVSFWNLLR